MHRFAAVELGRSLRARDKLRIMVERRNPSVALAGLLCLRQLSRPTTYILLPATANAAGEAYSIDNTWKSFSSGHQTPPEMWELTVALGFCPTCCFDSLLQERLGVNQPGHHPAGAAFAGAAATVFHDAVMTPMDVVKQRLQLGYHKGMLDCMLTIGRTEGAQVGRWCLLGCLCFTVCIPLSLCVCVFFGTDRADRPTPKKTWVQNWSKNAITLCLYLPMCFVLCSFSPGIDRLTTSGRPSCEF